MTNFSERLHQTYENLGESGQLSLYYENGAGTYQQRPAINPITGKSENNPSFALLRPTNDKVRWYNHSDGTSGDLYDFFKAVYGESYAKNALGFDDNQPQIKPIKKQKPAPPTQKPNRKPEALAIWNRSQPANQAVLNYLASRSITISPPESIRYHANMIVARVDDVDGNFLAVHQINLKKSNLQKFSLASVKGGSVRLAEHVNGQIAITEGIEDGLAVQQATGLPVWAALSTAGLTGLKLPETIQDILIFCDSDKSLAGQKVAQKLAARLHDEGRTIRIIYPIEQPTDGTDPVKKDFNDLLVEDSTGQLIHDRLAVAVPWTPPEPEQKPEPIPPDFPVTETLEASKASEKLTADVDGFLDETELVILNNRLKRESDAERAIQKDRLTTEWETANPEWADNPVFIEEIEAALEKNPEENVTLPPSIRKQTAKDAAKLVPYTPKPSETPPRRQIKATAGLGKTRSILKALSRGEWKDRFINYHVPTHQLGFELAEEAEKLGINAHVFIGRNAKNCIKPMAAEAAGRAGINVMSSLCSDGQFYCSNYHECQYLKQFRGNNSNLRIFTHSHLFIPSSNKLPPTDLTIVDENPTLGGISNTSFPPDRLDADGRAAIANHFDNNIQLKKSLKIAGITKESALKKAQGLDKELRENIYPNMPEDFVIKTLDRLKVKSNRETSAFWRQVAREWDFDRPFHGIETVKNYPFKVNSEGQKEYQNRIFIHKRKTVKMAKTLPVLLIDADCDLEINKLFFGQHLEEDIINAKLNAEVIQVSSSQFSRASFNGDSKRKETTLEKVKDFIREEAAKAPGKVLVITYKFLREKLTGQPAEGPGTPWGGATIAHFGGILGVDRWKDFQTVIVIGREQPRAESVEALGRGLFHDATEALDLPGKFKKVPRGYRMADGSQAGSKAWCHSDKNIQKVLELIRERQTGQALARLRLVHSTVQKKVILMSSLPIDIDVDKLLTAKELFSGGKPLQKVWDSLEGVMPLSGIWLASKFPEIVGSVRNANYLISNNNQMCNFAINTYKQTCTFDFRLEGQSGKNMKCLSHHSMEETKTRLETMFEKRVVSVSSLTGQSSPVTAPEAPQATTPPLSLTDPEETTPAQPVPKKPGNLEHIFPGGFNPKKWQEQQASGPTPANDPVDPRLDNPGIGSGARHCAACRKPLGNDYLSLGDDSWVHADCTTRWRVMTSDWAKHLEKPLSYGHG